MMKTTNEIRKTFLDFFARNGHEIVPSSPLVPRNDPTLMFTNAGMVQFKNVFTGNEKREYKRAVTSQKCVRAGGKHNDLENVGYTARHHTFFEMLGNFSFGDYFKDIAIEHAWNLITKEYNLPKEKLLVTVYADDIEAAELWKKIAGLGDDKVIKIASSDNFWAMGDTGPCGPCSEIFFDHGEHVEGGPPGSPTEDGDRFVEIWNLVFMQYEQVTKDKRVQLPKPSIDTGMGLERLAAILQGKHDNYDIDLMRALIEASADASKVDADGPHMVSHRVIADHMRASSFLISDGVLPSNEGRGYVLRRIMRRAMRHAHMIGCRDPLMWRLVPALIQQMGDAFGEIKRAESLISETLKLEETRFKETLDRGLQQLDEATAKLEEEDSLPGEIAFKLYDTFGFPLDLTQDILRTQGRDIELLGFETAMERQKATARAAWKGAGEAETDSLWFDLRERHGATDFFGYVTEQAEGEILAIVSSGKEINEIQSSKNTKEVLIVVNQSPFYGEAGGQIGDQGEMTTSVGARFLVDNTQRRVNDLTIHCGKIVSGCIRVGDSAALKVDVKRRNRLRANHSATHLMHQALRRNLGEHVTQKGSLVSPDRLRFDFNHPKGVDENLLKTIEEEVNFCIRDNSEVVTNLMNPESAIEAGAMALFGEKYGDEVRVVSMGGSCKDNSKSKYSVELCGGTHVARTGEIGLFRIISENAVSSGVRRIEAVTGAGALEYIDSCETLLARAASALKVSAEQLPERIASLLDERKRMERDLVDLRRKVAAGVDTQGNSKVINVSGIPFVAKVLEGIPARELKSMADSLKTEIGSGIAVIASTDDGKASLVIGVTRDLEGKVSAVELVRKGAIVLGGSGGGGRWDMAQAGGPNIEKINAAIVEIQKTIADFS